LLIGIKLRSYNEFSQISPFRSLVAGDKMAAWICLQDEIIKREKLGCTRVEILEHKIEHTVPTTWKALLAHKKDLIPTAERLDREGSKLQSALELTNFLDFYQIPSMEGCAVSSRMAIWICVQERKGLAKSVDAEGKEMKQEHKSVSSPLEKAKADYLQGMMYKNGVGVPKDEKAAFKCFEKATEYKFEVESLNIKLKYHLAEMHKRGKGTIKNPHKAAILFKEIAHSTHHLPSEMAGQAHYRIGRLYEKGDTVERNEDKAMEWYKKGAITPHAHSLFQLGLMHLKKRGCPRDSRDNIWADFFFTLASAIDDKQVLYKLALIYQLDEPSPFKALNCLERSAKLGHEEAQNRMRLKS
jgi:TPR repeat protein